MIATKINQNKFRTVVAFLLVTTSLAIKTRLTWVNGIAHNLDHMKDGKVSISDLFGGKEVDFCHNPTAMTSEDDYFGYVGDVTQAGTQKFGRITAEVDALVKHLKSAIQAVGKSGRVIHIAHSQGALITFLAAKLLSPDELSQIEVIAFGGAAAIRRDEFPHINRIVNYYSVNDPLLFVVPSAVRALRSGFLGAVPVNGNGAGLPNQMQRQQKEPEFVFLSPRVGDPVIDHGLLEPTYAEALGWEGRRFQQQYQSVMERARRAPVLLRVNVICAEMVEVMEKSVQVVLRYTLIPILLWILEAISWVRMRASVVREMVVLKCIIPMCMFLKQMIDLFKDIIRTFKREENFQPAST